MSFAFVKQEMRSSEGLQLVWNVHNLKPGSKTPVLTPLLASSVTLRKQVFKNLNSSFETKTKLHNL